MTEYSYSLADAIDDVDTSAWNQLRCECAGDGNVLMSPDYFRAVENAMASECRFKYLVIRSEDARPIALACLSLYSVDRSLLAGPKLKMLAQPLARMAPRLMHVKIVICGLPVSDGGNCLAIAQNADSAAVLKIVSQVAEIFAANQRARYVVYKEFREEECLRLKILHDLGYRRADSLPMNFITVRYSSFEECCRDLKSRRRWNIRRSQKIFAKSGFAVSQMTGRDGAADVYSDSVHRMYDEILDRAKVKLEQLPAEYFRELARQLPDNSSFTFIRDGDRIVAFAVSVFSESKYHQLFVGYDSERNRESHLYFNLFFHEMDAAYRRGVKEIDVGQTTDEFKQQKLGCQQRPLYLYVKGCYWSARILLGLGFRLLFPSRAPEQSAL